MLSNAQHANGYFELAPDKYLSAVVSNYNKDYEWCWMASDTHKWMDYTSGYTSPGTKQG